MPENPQLPTVDNTPRTTVVASTSITGVAGGLASLLVWVLAYNEITMPPEVAVSAVTALMTIIQFFINIYTR